VPPDIGCQQIVRCREQCQIHNQVKQIAGANAFATHWGLPSRKRHCRECCNRFEECRNQRMRKKGMADEYFAPRWPETGYGDASHRTTLSGINASNRLEWRFVIARAVSRVQPAAAIDEDTRKHIKLMACERVQIGASACARQVRCDVSGLANALAESVPCCRYTSDNPIRPSPSTESNDA